MRGGAPGRRSGVGNWLRGSGWMLRYEYASSRSWLGFFLLIQVLMSAGSAVLYGFYLPQVTPRLASFIVTGTPALALIPIGFAALPGRIADQKAAGSYEFLRALPVPRSATIAATAGFFMALALPGVVIALVLSALRYDVSLSVSPMIIPALLLTAVAASSVGAAIGYGIDNPMLTNLITNLLIFGGLLFSPIVFPPSQYPAWLVHLHEALPLYPMAIVLRDALSRGLVSDVGRAYAVLGGWTVAALAVAGFVTSRRR